MLRKAFNEMNLKHFLPFLSAKPEVVDEDVGRREKKGSRSRNMENSALGKSEAITLQTEKFSFISKGLTSGYS
jgi:hypothetical protein